MLFLCFSIRLNELGLVIYASAAQQDEENRDILHGFVSLPPSLCHDFVHVKKKNSTAASKMISLIKHSYLAVAWQQCSHDLIYLNHESTVITSLCQITTVKKP